MTDPNHDPDQALPSTHVTPFWRCLPAIFGYPLKPLCLMIIGLYSALLWLGSVLLFPMGHLIVLLTLVAAYQFCYSVLSWTAQGNLEPPEHFYLLQHWHVFWQQLLLWFCLGLLIGLTHHHLGSAWAWTLGLLVASVLPMATIALALEQSVLAVFNVSRLLEGIRRIGRAYWIMLLVLAVILILNRLIQWGLAQLQPNMISLFLMHAVWLYSSILLFHLMGYLIMQSHEVLNMTLNPQVLDRHQQLRRDQSDPVLMRLETLMADGQHRQARVMLRESIRRRAEDPSLIETYRRLCMDTDAPQDWYGFAGLQVVRLCESGAVGEALKLASTCLNEQPDFQLPEGDVILPLARAAHERGQHRLAVLLSRDFGKRYPRHRDAVALHLLVASVLFEHLNDEPRARAIVAYLIERAPDHPLAAEVRALQSHMEAISGSSS